MSRLIDALDRLLPSLLMATGVMLPTAAALSYAPSSFGGQPSAPAIGGGDPLLSSPPSAIPSPSAVPGASPRPIDIGPSPTGTTYIYAHAQRGMFLPLLRTSLVDDGASLVEALVEVYTTT